MPLTNTAKDLMLDALGGVAAQASLHTADPGATGANEVTGGTYTRQAITWNAATGGGLDNNANPTFQVPGGVTVVYFGLWSADGTTFYGSGALSAPETFGGPGQYTLTDADVTLT